MATSKRSSAAATDTSGLSDTLAHVLDAPLPPWLHNVAATVRQHPAHAVLLHGATGLGQLALAAHVAKAWLCESASALPNGPCGQCPSCHSWQVKTHPDFVLLAPETLQLAMQWPLDESAQKDIDSKKRKPSQQIRVEAMREMLTFALRTSSRGGRKVVLVYPAEAMNTVTANALLKTLEEPVGTVRFILATENLSQLLPTIVSRCQSVAMPWPDAALGVAWLVAQGVDKADAAVLIRAAGGRAEDALQLAQAGWSAKTWAQLPKAAAQGQLPTIAPWVATGTPDKLSLLQKIVFDALAVHHQTSPKTHQPAPDHPLLQTRFFAPQDVPIGLDASLLAAWAKELGQQQRHADHPFAPALMSQALQAAAQAAMRVSCDNAP